MIMSLEEIHVKKIASLLDTGITNPVVLIEAPHGYSKRELVRRFVLDSEINFAWLSLGRMDNWAFYNWKHLLEEIKGAFPDQVGDHNQLEFKLTPDQMTVFTGSLGEVIADNGPLLLILDDYSILVEQQVRLFYETLIEAKITGLHLLIISSEKTNLEELCLRCDVDCFMIGEKELRLTPVETRRYFARNSVDITLQQAEQVTDTWKGWPLPILMLSEYQDIDELQEGALEPVHSLFYSNYFDRYPQRIKNILIRMSLLSVIPIELYAFLTEEEKRVIENNPLIYCDHVNGIFTLQKDYKNFLAARQGYLSEEQKTDTFRRAGDILLKREQFNSTLPLLIQGKEYDKAVALVWELIDHFTAYPILKATYQQISQLPDDYLDTHPRAILQQASMLFNLDEIRKGEELLWRVIDRYKAGQISDCEVVGEAYFLLYQVARMDGHENIVEYARLASEYLPNGSRYWCDPISVLREGIKVRFPPYDEKRPELLEEARETFKKVNPYLTIIFGGKNVHIDKLCEAEISYYRFDLKDARIKMLELVHLAERGQIHELVLVARQYLVRIALLKGDEADASKQISHITSFIQDSKLYQYNGSEARIQSLFSFSQRESDDLYIRLNEHNLNQEARWELTRNGLTQARFLIQNHLYEESIALLNSLEDDFKPYKGCWLGTLYVKVFRAISYARINDKAAAIADLYDAYKMTWGNSIIAPFIECEVNMRFLVEIAREEAPEKFDPEWLELIFVKSNNLARRTTQRRKNKLAEKNAIELTPRRVEILRDMADGLSAKEIAEKRNIKESTVRTHIKNICNDLGAINRANAVQIAISKRLI